jgi:uncharacterized membrane protein YgdD (TMEM256/DUF423 family)
MNYKNCLIAGAAFATLGVLIGAFGAHQLKEVLTQTGRTETFELAVRYQFYHAFALLVAGILQKTNAAVKSRWPGLFFSGGILLFSGSLYVLSVTGVTILGAVTPIGGLLFIAGWISTLIGISRA